MAGTNVGTAFLEIVPSARGFAGKLQGEVGGDFAKAGRDGGTAMGEQTKKSFGSSIKGLFAMAGAAALGAGAVSFVKDAFAEAREGQKVGALTEAVIKSTGGAAKVSAEQIGDLAGAISKKTGIDDEAVQSGANLLLTFKNIRNETGKGNDIFNQATASMVDMAAGMAAASGGSVDFRSASTMLGKALNDPIKGLAAMGRVGVQFTKSQQEAIKKMVESGDTMGAQKAILKELNAQFGGAAESQATAADKAQVAWGNLKEEIGTKLLPVADRFANWATDDLIPAMSDAANFIEDNKNELMLLVGAITAGVAAGKIYTAVTTVMAAVSAAQAVATGGATAAQVALNTAMRANLIGIIVTGLVLLVGGLILAYKKSETFRNIIQGAFRAVANAIAWVVDGAAKLMDVFAKMLRGLSKVPGFGWAKGAADTMQNAANKARGLADSIRNIPPKKDIEINVKARMPAVLTAAGIRDWQVYGGARAKGGPVTEGETYLVGENGPEMFTASRSGRIIPNHQLDAARPMGGGGGRYEFVITNWKTGEGYMAQIADSRVGSAISAASEARRAGDW